MDNDITGIYEAIWLRNNYHIEPFLIPKKYNAKDFAELVCNNKIEVVGKLLIKTINYLMNYGKDNKPIGDKREDSSLPF